MTIDIGTITLDNETTLESMNEEIAKLAKVAWAKHPNNPMNILDARIRVLEEMHKSVNACGGVPANMSDKGACEEVDRILFAIEKRIEELKTDPNYCPF